MSKQFNEDGTYNKTDWKAGDKITATKLNKIEDAIEAVNDHDISRHEEADARLDALEAGVVANKQEIEAKVDALEDTVVSNKDAADLDIYRIDQHMTLLDKKIDEGVAEVYTVAETVDGKIAEADASMKAQVAEADAIVEQGKVDLKAITTPIVNVMNFKDSVVDNDWGPVIQSLIDSNDGRVIYFPTGIYEVKDTIIIPGQNTYELRLMGDGDSSVIELVSDVEGKALFCMKSILQYKNRYKTFERLCFNATRAELQTFLTWQPYSDEKTGTESPFRVKNCTINTAGYNINLDQCQWAGDSYIKECNCKGGGFMYVKPSRVNWIGDAYPHSFSNLVIEDVHFSTYGGWPRYSLLYLEGAQNTYIKSLTLEGASKHFNPGYTDLGKAGSYITIVGGSVTFDTLWCEHGGTDNVSSTSYDFAFWGLEGAWSTNPSIVTFDNCYHVHSKMFIGFPNDILGIYPNVDFNNATFSRMEGLDIDINAGYATFNNCYFRNQNVVSKYKGNPRIKFIGASVPLSTSNSTQGYGVRVGSSDDINTIVLYQYKGGFLSNSTLPMGMYNGWGNLYYNYPHFNPNYGHSIISYNYNWGGHFTSCAPIAGYADMANYNITYPMEIYTCYTVRLHHHETSRDKLPVTTYCIPHTITNHESLRLLFRGLFQDNAELAYSRHYNWVELLDICVSNKPLIRNSIHYTADCMNVPDLERLGGTWIKGDRINSSYMEDEIYTKICKKNGTSRTINVNGIVAEESDKIYIPVYLDLVKFLGGEYILINNVEYMVLDYFYGEDDTKNYIQLNKTTGLSTSTSVTITNSPPDFVIK